MAGPRLINPDAGDAQSPAVQGRRVANPSERLSREANRAVARAAVACNGDYDNPKGREAGRRFDTSSAGYPSRRRRGRVDSVLGAGRYGGVTVPALPVRFVASSAVGFPDVPVGRRIGDCGVREPSRNPFPASRASWRPVGRRPGSGPCRGVVRPGPDVAVGRLISSICLSRSRAGCPSSPFRRDEDSLPARYRGRAHWRYRRGSAPWAGVLQ